METLKFVFVGHIDHGKSTLIGRLLYDTDSLSPDKLEEIRNTANDMGRDTEFAHLLDHLEEERQQGITIETTQVFFKTDKREYIIIDAPGHVEFVKNMITGASYAEAAVVLLDAQEGIKEQTKRHTYILSLLGIKQVIVAINKMDLVNYDEEVFNTLRENINTFLKELNIEQALFIPISALHGENITTISDKMSWYAGPTFLDSLNTLRTRELPQNKALIFPVQDVYKVDEKRITVGRIEAGSLTQGQTIKILPHEQSTIVATIEQFPTQVGNSIAGESTGFTTQDSVFLNRGDVVCVKDQEPHYVDTFRANVFWLSKKDFDKNERLIIRCSTQETTCVIDRIINRIDSSTFDVLEQDATVLKNLEVGEVILKTKKPIAVKSFEDVQELGRFVLVRDENTCAGGIVVEVA